MTNQLLFLGNMGGQEILIIALIILLLFGGKKIPELMKSMGKGVKFFKQGMNDIEEEINRPLEQQSTENQSSEQQANQDGK